MTGLAASILLQMALLTTGAQPYQEALDSSKTDGQPLLVLVGAGDWRYAADRRELTLGTQTRTADLYFDAGLLRAYYFDAGEAP